MVTPEFSIERPPTHLRVECRSCDHLQKFIEEIEDYEQYGVTEEWVLIFATRYCTGKPKIEAVDTTLEPWQIDDAKLCTVGLLRSKLRAEINDKNY
jgi:hypothetical protein